MSAIKSNIVLACLLGLAILAPASQAKDVKKARMLVFTSQHCGPCLEAQPAVDAVITQCKKRNVIIQEFDLSKPKTEFLAAKYRLIGTPTFVFLDKEGNEVARLLGQQSEDALRQALSAAMGEACEGLKLLKPKTKNTKKKFPKKAR